MYSFIKPRKKYSLDNLTYMWLGFIVIISIMLIVVALYIDKKNTLYKYDLTSLKEKNLKIVQKQKEIKKDIKEYLVEDNIAKRAYSSNNSLERGLRNLFALVPNQIKINKLYLTKYEVKIYGETDSPKTYKLLLEPPLKSIFDKSKVGFTKKDEKSYLFSSYNTIKGVKVEK